MTPDHAELRRLAEAATPGEWQRASMLVYALGEHGGTICAMSEPRANNMVAYTAPRLDSPDFEEAAANAAYIVAAANAIPLLLDELEAEQADHDRCDDLRDGAVEDLQACHAERDSLAAQVARLWEALAEFSQQDSWVRLPRDDFKHAIAGAQIYGWNDMREPWRIHEAILADTAASAKAWQRQERAKGGWSYAMWVQEHGNGSYDTWAAMEAEASQEGAQS